MSDHTLPLAVRQEIDALLDFEAMEKELSRRLEEWFASFFPQPEIPRHLSLEEADFQWSIEYAVWLPAMESGRRYE